MSVGARLHTVLCAPPGVPGEGRSLRSLRTPENETTVPSQNAHRSQKEALPPALYTEQPPYVSHVECRFGLISRRKIKLGPFGDGAELMNEIDSSETVEQLARRRLSGSPPPSLLLPGLRMDRYVVPASRTNPDHDVRTRHSRCTGSQTVPTTLLAAVLWSARRPDCALGTPSGVHSSFL